MNSAIVFGSYYPQESIIHNLDPRTKLISTLVLGILTFISNDYIGLSLLGAFIVFAFSLSKIPIAQGLRSIAPLSFVIILTVLFNLFFIKGGEVYVDFGVLKISEDGVHLATFLGIRLLLLMLTGCLLTLTTKSFDIAAATEYLLKPLAKFGFPSYEFAFVFSLSLSNVAQLSRKYRIVKLAQISRGVNLPTNKRKNSLLKISSLLVPLLASVFRHADTLSCAMDARCYRGGENRTSLHPLKFSRNDTIAAIIMTCLFVLIMLVNLI